MKALIATGLGVLALGGLLVANSGRSASAQVTSPASLASGRTTLVNCGDDRQAVIWSANDGSGAARVECVSREAAAGMATAAVPVAMPFAAGFTAPVSYGPTAYGPAVPQVVPQIVQPAVQERVVYRDRVVTAPARTSTRRVSAPARTYRTSSATYEKPVRSWKKSAAIIGGSTAAGAGVGAIFDGKSGAKKGAVVGLIGGTVYDIATRAKK